MPKGIELLSFDWLIRYLHLTSNRLDCVDVNIVTSQQEGCEFESILGSVDTLASTHSSDTCMKVNW